MPLNILLRHAARLRRDSRGMASQHWALVAGAVAIVSIVSVHTLDLAARNGALPTVVFKRPNDDLQQIARTLPQPTVTSVRQNAAGIDYTATASIASPGTVVLDPCTGKPK